MTLQNKELEKVEKVERGICMDLIPLPQKITLRDGSFIIAYDTCILLDTMQNDRDFETARLLQKELRTITTLKLPISKRIDKDGAAGENCIFFQFDEAQTGLQTYHLTVNPSTILITAGSSHGFLYGAATLIQLCKTGRTEIRCVEIQDEPTFLNRGYMLDVSRGRIPTMENLKSLVDRLALYKINQLQLYMEDCLRIEGLEEVWSQTDPFTPEEILDLDLYCDKRGIELVPCIATFGHLYDLLRSESFRQYCEMDSGTGEPFTWYHRMRYHILNISKPESYDFVTTILDRYLPLFRSNKINICCDETFDLGKGKSAPMLEKTSYGELYLSFVNRLIGYLQNKGKEVMIWADIVQNHPECLSKLNPDVTCLNWYYYYNAKAESAKILQEHGIKQYVCPSVSGYSRLINEFDMSFTNIREMAKLGDAYGARGLLNTEWGDTGHINMPSVSVPGLIYGAAQAWNVKDDRGTEEIDALVSILEFGDKERKIVGLLRELSRQDRIIFNDLVFFRDYKVYNLPYHDFNTCLYENSKAKIMETTQEQLTASICRSKEILQRMKQLSWGVNAPEQAAFQEFYLSARGVALIQEISMVIKKQEFGQDIQLLETPSALAAKLEYWLMDYCEAWKVVSRESELFRIKEFFFQICLILRKYDVR